MYKVKETEPNKNASEIAKRIIRKNEIKKII